MSISNTRVLVVGAGPTGLTAAVELARHGLRVEVIDRRIEASTLSRAVGILPQSLKLLEPSGVTAELLQQGIKLEAVRIYYKTALKLTLPFKNAHPEHNYILALAQDKTEAILRQALFNHGGTISYGTELTGLRQNESQVTIEDNHGHEISVDYVIGADGIKSRTRQALGIEYAGHDLPETWSIADVDADNWINPNIFSVCLLNAGQVAVVAPLESSRFRIISNTEDALASLPLPINITNIRRQAQFEISIRQVNQYAMSRVFLAGDAAHCHSPVGGRGMNLGIADAVELARRIAENDLAGYHPARHSAGAETIALSERARKIMTASNPMARGLLLGGFAFAGILPLIKSLIARRFLGS